MVDLFAEYTLIITGAANYLLLLRVNLSNSWCITQIFFNAASTLYPNSDSK